MKESPPKASEYFFHIYNIKGLNIFFKNNETFGILNKNIIPNVYYNHLMINDTNKTFNNKHKYNRISVTNRHKKKLLTIIYYSP